MHTLKDGKGSHYKKVYVYPDYTSSGIWCSCGLAIANPSEEIAIPHSLTELIEFWNDYWDFASTTASKNKWDNEAIEYHRKKILVVGRILSKQLSQFVPCELLEDRCELNITDFQWPRE